MIDAPIACARGCLRHGRHATDCDQQDPHTPGCVNDQCDGCNAEQCPGCLPREAETGLLCRTCTERLETLLAGPDDRESVAGACEWLADNLGQHLRSAPMGGTGRSANPGEGFVTVMAALRDLQVGFAKFAADFLASRSMRPLEDTSPVHIAARLRPWLGTIAAWEPIADTLDGLIAWRGQAHGVCPWRHVDRQCEGVPCPACRHKTLSIPAGEVDVWCGTCGAVHGRAVYDRLTALVAWEAQTEQRITDAKLGDDERGSLEELAKALGVPWGTLRRWKSLGWLPRPIAQRGRADIYDARDLALVVARIKGAA